MIFRHTIKNNFLLSFKKSLIIAGHHLESKSTVGPMLAQHQQNIEISNLSCGRQATIGPTWQNLLMMQPIANIGKICQAGHQHQYWSNGRMLSGCIFLLSPALHIFLCVPQLKSRNTVLKTFIFLTLLPFLGLILLC